MIDILGLLSLGCEGKHVIGAGVSRGVASAIENNFDSNKCRLEIVPFSDARRLVRALRKGSVNAAVRGTLKTIPVLSQLKKEYSVKAIMRTALMEDNRGRQFLLAPVGIDEGLSLKTRMAHVLGTLAYFSQANWDIGVGVLSKGRREDGVRGNEIRKSLQEGEKMVKALRARGVRAKHFQILIENAVSESDFIVAPDGVGGNLIFRSMHFLGGAKAYGAPVVNIPDVFVDTSRAKADFSDSILLAAGLATVRSRLKL